MEGVRGHLHEDVAEVDGGEKMATVGKFDKLAAFDGKFFKLSQVVQAHVVPAAAHQR